MPNLSKRILNMPASPIRKLAKYAVEAKKRGVKVYHVNIGQPDIETPELIRNAINSHSEKIIAYSPSQGFADYLEEISKWYKEHNIDIDTDEMLVTAGGSEAILFSLMAITNPGDEIIIPEPFYANYNGFCHMAGVNIKPVTTYLEDGFKLPCYDKLKEQLSDKTKAVLICNPNNPTGAVYSRSGIQEIIKFCKDNDLFLISDEAYCEITQQDMIVSLLEFKGIEDFSIVVDSVSKRFSLCGVRIGRVVTKNKQIIREILKCAQARLSPPYYGQIASMAALKLPDSYLVELANEYQNRIKATCSELEKIEGITYHHSEGAFYIIVKLPVESTEDFAKYLLADFFDTNPATGAKETVMVAPAGGFYKTRGLGLDEIRIACVLNGDLMKRAVQILGTALKNYLTRN